MDTISEARLLTVAPKLRDAVHALAAALGFPVRVTQARRSSDEQHALWAQGRLPLADVNSLREKVGWAPIAAAANAVTVTNAEPGQSWHEYGLAVDVVPMTLDGGPDWDEQHPQWAEIVSEARKIGLVDGIGWHDEPHLQLAAIPASPTPFWKNLLANKGIDACMAACS